MATMTTDVAAMAIPVTGEADDYDRLLDLVGDARVVCLGEASHGTQEFYAERARITQRLIAEHGFAAVAAEADWPDAYRANCWVRGVGEDATIDQALGAFQRFPAWMWRNTVVAAFLEWLRTWNAARPRDDRVGFYGLDLYSLHASMAAVIGYLDRVDPAAAARARERYGCFDHAAAPDDGQAYGAAAAFGAGETCEDEVVQHLLELQGRAALYAARDGLVAEDDLFYAEQNAILARDAERYYRTMYQGSVSSWNLRDRHMADTLVALDLHLSRQRRLPARLVVWEHNSHVGDARATEFSGFGQLNVGQLVRERYRQDAVLVGFTTHAGTVTAADDWGGSARHLEVRPALAGSWEALFHGSDVERFLLLLREAAEVADELRSSRLERAIGVVYRPQTERASHYFHAHLADQFDAVVHLDQTNALEPLGPVTAQNGGEPPETYPFAV